MNSILFSSSFSEPSTSGENLKTFFLKAWENIFQDESCFDLKTDRILSKGWIFKKYSEFMQRLTEEEMLQ